MSILPSEFPETIVQTRGSGCDGLGCTTVRILTKVPATADSKTRAVYESSENPIPNSGIGVVTRLTNIVTEVIDES